MVRAAPCLPLWGRWQPEGLTEEVFGYRFAEKRKKFGKPLPTSLRSATLPKGEGKEASNTNTGYRLYTANRKTVIFKAGGAAALASPFGRGAPVGGGEGPLSHGLGRDSSPIGGAKAFLGIR